MKINDTKLVYLSEFVTRFCIWSVLSGLLVHLTQFHWVTMPKALYIVGISFSLLYLSSILGGVIKDHLFEEKIAITLGIFLIAAGNFFLLFSKTFFIGLGFLLIGAGMVTPNTPLLLSKWQGNNESKIFTYFYGISNLGIIMGPLIGGFLAQYFLWWSSIFLNEMFIFTWLFVISFNQWLKKLKEINQLIYFKFFILVLLSNLIIYFCLKSHNTLMYLLSFSIIGYGIFICRIFNVKEFREKFIFALALIIFAIIFFSGEFQVASSLIAYSENFVNLKELNFTIPASSIVSLESFFVVIGSVIFGKTILFTRIKFSQTKVLLGMICCAGAYFILFVSTRVAEIGKISFLWIITAFLLFGIGEISLMPTIVAYIAKISPEKYKGRLMSGMYFALSISGYLSGFISEKIMRFHHFSSNNILFYRDFFMIIIIISVLCVFLLSLLRFNKNRFLGVLQ